MEDIIKMTSFYSRESEKTKLNWFCYEIALSIELDMLFKIFYSQFYKRQQHQLSGLPPALKGARKSECAPTRRNSPSGRLA
jgi:hypothetical protein